MPKDMMSGPFTAALEYGTELGMSENSTDASMRSLIITGQKHDVGMDMEGMGDSTQHSHRIVISATNVLPEFPLGIASVGAALTITGVLLAAKWHSFFLSGKTY